MAFTDWIPTAFMTAQMATIALTAGAATFVAVSGRKKTADARSLMAGAVAAAAAIVVSVLLGIELGAESFGVIRLIYLGCVVATPLSAAMLLLLGALRFVTVTRAATILAAIGLCPAPLGAYASWIEPNRLVVERTEFQLARERTGREPITLGILADFQADSIGDHERRAIDLLMAQHPDVILIPGDLFQADDVQWKDSRTALRDVLSKLDAPGGVFFVPGDVDTEYTFEVLRQTRIRILQNEIVRIQVRDRSVTIGAVERTHMEAAGQLESLSGSADIRILLSHRPDAVFHLSERTRVDLTVAGHTHGGQVVIPGFGPPLTLTHVPRKVAAGGLHWMDGRAIYVSRGVGMERLQAPPMRFNCVPEISILTLK